MRTLSVASYITEFQAKLPPETLVANLGIKDISERDLQDHHSVVTLDDSGAVVSVERSEQVSPLPIREPTDDGPQTAAGLAATKIFPATPAEHPLNADVPDDWDEIGDEEDEEDEEEVEIDDDDEEE